MRQGCRATCASFCRLALGSRVPAPCALLRAAEVGRAMRKGGAVWITAPGKRRCLLLLCLLRLLRRLLSLLRHLASWRAGLCLMATRLAIR